MNVSATLTDFPLEVLDPAAFATPRAESQPQTCVTV